MGETLLRALPIRSRGAYRKVMVLQVVQVYRDGVSVPGRGAYRKVMVLQGREAMAGRRLVLVAVRIEK